MPTSFRDCVAEFVDKPPGQIRIVVIHLNRAKEREECIRTLEAAIQTPLEIWAAAEGSALIAAGHPTECGIDPGIQRTAGEVGCIASHVELARSALAEGTSHLVVFEDDCIPGYEFSLDALEEYLHRVRRFAIDFNMPGCSDFTLLSTCGCYIWRHLTLDIKITDHFNGSHAYIMGRPMMQKMVDFYDSLIAKGQAAPVDGILPILLQRENRWAFCPDKDTRLFRQDRSIPSYVVSNGAALRTG